METFVEKYCALQRCTPVQFRRRMFWGCLHSRVWPFAPFLFVYPRDYFAPDLALIEAAGNSQTMEEIWVQTRLYFSHPSHRLWIRREANIRISVHKLIKVATEYLPPGAKPPGTDGGRED